MPSLWPAPLVADTQTQSAIQDAKDCLIIDTAEGDWLTRIGQNYGIPRPKNDELDDVLYRKIIKTLAWLPKGTLFAIYKLLEAIFGTQQSFIDLGQRPWRVYEVNPNEFIVEIPLALIASNNERSSYLHGYTGRVTSIRNPISASQFDVTGDVSKSAATSLVGERVSVSFGDPVWQSRTISGLTYNPPAPPLPETTTVQVSAPFTPAAPTAGAQAFIDVPGDEVASYRGDYLATGGFIATFTTLPGPPTTTALLQWGDLTPKVKPGDVVEFRSLGHLYSLTVSTVTYNGDGTTTLILTTPLPGGQSGSATLPMEVADGTHAPHRDRVYLTGVGLLAIFQYYMLKLDRVSGIVVRYVQI